MRLLFARTTKYKILCLVKKINHSSLGGWVFSKVHPPRQAQTNKELSPNSKLNLLTSKFKIEHQNQRLKFEHKMI
jgi:hypothetical protein